MKYKKRKAQSTSSFTSTPLSGAMIEETVGNVEFIPWRPSTWPEAPKEFNEDFAGVFERIIRETILDELKNVVGDIVKSHGSLQHRGHVVGAGLMCALEVLSTYGYRSKDGSKGSVRMYVQKHFPDEYKPYAAKFYDMYRNDLVHQWNLFSAALLPGNEPVTGKHGIMQFGLLNFLDAFSRSIDDFLDTLSSNEKVQYQCVDRYRRLRKRARG